MTESTLLLLTTIMAVLMSSAVIMIRLKAIKRPASVKKIIIPPIMMSTGFLMFVYEPARLETLQIFGPLITGVICSYFLIRTSNFHIREGEIYMERSKMFIYLLVGLLIARVIVKLILGEQVVLPQLAGMFFLLAFGMILPWRIAMLHSFKKIHRKATRDGTLWNLSMKGERT
ncbi:CcdC family protein [Geomicrobium sp. JCM 19055]|uniref:CcdC family protein n=1 Tax=Geomicrobium sp. JCM 19055 TaxID=1460649 RepID=UPI0005AA0F3E|nr:cytochrome c biogenesis protein CcdC [Geomicrobium sp. JCM 19055]